MVKKGALWTPRWSRRVRRPGADAGLGARRDPDELDERGARTSATKPIWASTRGRASGPSLDVNRTVRAAR